MKQEKIIVIEDNEVIAEILLAMFQEMGHRVQWAAMPEDAFEMIEQAHVSDDAFTVASVDKLFPVGQLGDQFALGERVTRRIKRDFPYIATVMITGEPHTAQEILELRDDYGVDQFLQKDGIGINALQSAIERATGRVNHHIATGQIRYETQTPSRYTQPEVLMCKPIFGVPHQVSVFDCDVFMIMPFSEAFKPIYSDRISPLVESYDLSIKRGDDFFSKHDIMTEVWSALYASQFVIADCTGHNANVFYELGMAHTLGKTAIMITQSIDHIPFDIRARRVIRYENTPEGLLRLEREMRTAIEQIINNGAR